MSRHPIVIANDRSALRVWPFVFLGCALLFLWQSWSMRQAGPLLFALLYAALAGLHFVQVTRWRRIHLQRILATSEGVRAGVPLVHPQPVPHAEGLPVSFAITLRPRVFHLLACIALAGTVIFLLFRFDPFPLQSAWQSALFVAGLIIVLSSWRFFLSQRIVVYDDRLVVQHPLYDWWSYSWIGNNWQAGEHVIGWREARLFAIRSGLPGTPATRYELSSPSTVVTFGRARPTRWWALYHPVLPWEEYEAQMDALLDFIAAKTGLPLYDVRGRPAAGPSPQPFLFRE